jgi:rubredoxin
LFSLLLFSFLRGLAARGFEKRPSHVMQIVRVDAQDRFDNVKLDNVVDWPTLTANSMFTIYTCPRCNEKIKFQRSDFEKVRKKRNWTNFPPEVARRFDEFASKNGLDMRYFLDWLCPKCGLPARVLIECWAGGRYGDYGFNLHSVLEYSA